MDLCNVNEDILFILKLKPETFVTAVHVINDTLLFANLIVNPPEKLCNSVYKYRCLNLCFSPLVFFPCQLY